MNTEAINQHKSKLSAMLEAINPNHDLVPHAYAELVEIDRTFLELAKHTKNTDRELRIAVVGQVKAGKSSFLNAILFKGKEILPKAITPTTAALTIISHSEQQRAEIQFYDADEWQNMLDNAEKYHQVVNDERTRILKEQEEDKGGLLRRKKLSREDDFKDKVSEIFVSAYELVKMVSDSGINTKEYIGTKPKIIEAATPEELSKQLNEYVVVKGRYAPMVKYCKLYYNLPELAGFEIVDTPGLNDPVLSRGRMTKQFLAKCDVAFMLSYAGQFLDQSDMNLLHEQLPDAGIKDVIIAGSKFDLLLKGESKKHKDVGALLDNLEGTLRARATEEVIRRLKNTESEHEQNLYSSILSGFKKVPIQFISAKAYGASQHFDFPADDEKHLINELNSLYPGTLVFDAETLLKISNVGDNSPIRKLLADKCAGKKRIIAEKMASFLIGQQEKLQRIGAEIKAEALRGKERLLNGDIQTIEERSKQISTRLRDGQGGIELVFEEGISGIKKKFSLLLTEMKETSTRFSRLDVKSGQKFIEVEYKRIDWLPSWVPFNSSTRSSTVTYRYAETHEAINQVEEYVIASEKQLKKAIRDLIDTAVLKKDIQEAVTKLFDLGDPDLDAENNILLPVQRAIAKITVPDVDLSNGDYTKEITSKFSSGQVLDDQVEALRKAQKKAIAAVLKNFEAAVNKESARVVSSLENTQKEFTVNMVKDIVADLEKLGVQLKDREKSLARYDQLLAVLAG